MVKKDLPSFDSLVDDRCSSFQHDKKVDIIMRSEVLKYPAKEVAAQVGVTQNYIYAVLKRWRTDPKYRSKVLKKLDG